MNKYKLYGAILGDLCGQPFEFKKNGYNKPIQIHNPDSIITDDTLMTLASANSLLRGTHVESEYRLMGKMYAGDYYGKNFKEWLQSPLGTINDSYGNGCLMRISPFMYIKDKVEARERAIRSCLGSHCHPYSIIAVSKLVDMYEEAGLRSMASRFNAKLQKFEKFEVGAKETIAFIEDAYWIESDNDNSITDTIIKTVECGGDTDTNASIVGELMNYTFKNLTKEDVDYVESKLDTYLRGILFEFNKRF